MNTFLESQFQFYLNRIPLSDHVELYIKDRLNHAICTNLEFTKKHPGELANPCMTLTNTDLQSLFDELWRLGFRSSEYIDEKSALAATQFHLSDMRKLVFENRD